MVDTSVLDSEWVEPKGGSQWGFRLKDGAPEDIARQFAEYEAAVDAVHKAATGE